MLTLKMAKALIRGAQEEAVCLGVTIVVSVVDNHGNLKAFERMDNTSYGSVRVSQLKGQTSASFPVSTAQLAERSASFEANPYGSIPDMLLLGGGLPVFSKSGEHIGAIGISGATPEIDAQCAQAGIEAMSVLLSEVE